VLGRPRPLSGGVAGGVLGRSGHASGEVALEVNMAGMVFEGLCRLAGSSDVAMWREMTHRSVAE
jgi:hypothetical protein